MRTSKVHDAALETVEVRGRWLKLRSIVLVLMILAIGSAVGARAWVIQVRDGANYRDQAVRRQERPLRLAPKRGNILDRSGRELAVSVDVDSVFLNPRVLQRSSLATSVDQLALAMGVPALEIRGKASQDRAFVWLRRHVTPAVADAVRALNIDGVGLVREARRFYPQGMLASHVLGFVNIDGVGLEGVESTQNQRLAGNVQSQHVLRDRRGEVVYGEHLEDMSSARGDDVVLTIDSVIQAAAERELSLAIRTVEARAGSVVVLDPNTGQLLALASFPTYDPNRPGDFPASDRRLRAVTDRFEPGSTIKPFTIGAALAQGVVHARDPIDCEGGSMTLGEDVIHDSHAFNTLTASEILAYSSNIGTAKIGFLLGRAGLYRAFRRFGFGARTEIEIPGETAGILRHHRNWYDFDLATASFGQGMSVTAVRLASAMGVIAAGGRLFRPTLVRELSHPGGARESLRNELVRQVIPSGTARLVADMLTSVTTEEGTGAEAAIPGFVVAGKTGTAQKADYNHGGYAEGLWTASFVGFVPADRPRLVIAVVIDEPTVDHYGGTVAGPVFRRVGQAALAHLGLAVGTRATVLPTAQQRQPGARERAPTVASAVPDFVGMTMRQALERARAAGVEVQLTGSGVCVAQDPDPRQAGDGVSLVRLAFGQAEQASAAATSATAEATSREAAPVGALSNASAVIHVHDGSP